MSTTADVATFTTLNAMSNVAIVVADGLSSAAVHAHAAPLIAALAPRLDDAGLRRTDVVLAHSPHDVDALRVKQTALNQLLTASGRENHSEVQWLEQEIKSTATEGDA